MNRFNPNNLSIKHGVAFLAVVCGGVLLTGRMFPGLLVPYLIAVTLIAGAAAFFLADWGTGTGPGTKASSDEDPL